MDFRIVVWIQKKKKKNDEKKDQTIVYKDCMCVSTIRKLNIEKILN